ncbi:Sad1-UNC-like carboxy terminal protein [Schizosaccharomyces pombe]
MVKRRLSAFGNAFLIYFIIFRLCCCSPQTSHWCKYPALCLKSPDTHNENLVCDAYLSVIATKSEEKEASNPTTYDFTPTNKPSFHTKTSLNGSDTISSNFLSKYEYSNGTSTSEFIDSISPPLVNETSTISSSKKLEQNYSVTEVIDTNIITSSSVTLPISEDGSSTSAAATIDSNVDEKTVAFSEEKRFNFASTDCAAAVIKTNPEAVGSSSILTENKDKYMLNKCSAENKFVVIELCEDIYVDTVQIANFEFFSSIFRDFKVSVSGKYPKYESSWMELGTFTALNLRTLQSFHIENPLIWAKYLKIEFLTHYGSEFYCPVSLLRVYGKTMIEEFEEANEDFLEQKVNDGSAIKADEIQKPQESPIFVDEDDTDVQSKPVRKNSSVELNSTDTLLSSTVISKSLSTVVIGNETGKSESYPATSTRSFNDISPSSSSSYSTAQISTFPSNQESIYKNINKRLSILEERKKAFDEIAEKILTNYGKHNAKNMNFTQLLHELNSTLQLEISKLSKSVVKPSLFALQAKLELLSAENEYFQSQITSLYQESSFQKRLLMLQLTVLIVLTVYMAVSRLPENLPTTRSSSNNPTEASRPPFSRDEQDISKANDFRVSASSAVYTVGPELLQRKKRDPNTSIRSIHEREQDKIIHSRSHSVC